MVARIVVVPAALPLAVKTPFESMVPIPGFETDHVTCAVAPFTSNAIVAGSGLAGLTSRDGASGRIEKAWLPPSRGLNTGRLVGMPITPPSFVARAVSLEQVHPPMVTHT